MINGEYIAHAEIAIKKWPRKHGDLFYTVYTVKKNIFLLLKKPGSFDFGAFATNVLFYFVSMLSSIFFYDFLFSSLPV